MNSVNFEAFVEEPYEPEEENNDNLTTMNNREGKSFH